MALMGIDAGITGVKAVVFDPAGKPLSSAYREYTLHQPGRGRAELDPSEVWEAASAVIAEAARGAPEPVTALGVSSMGEAAVPTGTGGEWLAPIISPIDGRAADISERLVKRFTKQTLYRITGLPPHPCYTVNSILWLRENEPAVFRKVWKFLCIQDYIGYRLTGEAKMDYSMASRTGLFDIKAAMWSGRLFEALELSPSMLSMPVKPGTPIGKVSSRVAGKLGLGKETILCAGGHDQPVCALGAGAIADGVADLSLGTVECLTNTHRKPVINKAVIERNFPVYFHALPGHYTSLAYNFTSGALLRWFRDNFAPEESAEAARAKRSVYELLFEEMDDRLTEVLVLPHFVGTGTPHLDPRAKGAFVNLALATDRRELFLACVQGTVLEMMLNYRALKECKLAPHTINAIGGGARAEKWLQMRADALGIAINRMSVEEAGCAGAAILAGLGTGVYSDGAEGAKAFGRIERTFEPRRERAAAWEETFEKYRGLYEGVKPFRM